LFGEKSFGERLFRGYLGKKSFGEMLFGETLFREITLYHIFTSYFRRFGIKLSLKFLYIKHIQNALANFVLCNLGKLITSFKRFL
jgi:hypothetical protein